LPVKIFVFCNKGYLSIRETQKNFFQKKYLGSSEKGGLSLPSVIKVAKAYKIPTYSICRNTEIKRIISRIFQEKGPIVCELKISPTFPVSPSVGFTKKADGSMKPRPLEDMRPFLNREEFKKAMIVDPV
jgi:acetolactate synthase-1/2/3 large subunit